MYEIQIPEPHGPTAEQDRYNQVLAQVDLADEVGSHLVRSGLAGG